jgi:hypothetical protein
LLGGGGLAAVETAVPAGVRAATGALGRAGIGPKSAVLDAEGRPLLDSDGKPVRVTESQRSAIAQRLANAAGHENIDTVQRALNDAPEQLVPGSQSTTAQVAPTPGLVSLEAAHRVATPEPFNERAAAQNSARLGAIQGLAPENARPDSLGDYFRSQLDQLEQIGQSSINSARQGVSRATNALGGFGQPSELGAATRALLERQNVAAQAWERRLWQAVDPDGTLALSAAPIRDAAKQLLGEVNPAVGDVLSAPESALLNGSASLPGVIRFSDLSSLRSNISAAQRQLAPSVGWDSRPMRRLGMLKSAVDGTIADAVNTEAASNPNVASSLQGMLEQTGGSGQRAAAAGNYGGGAGSVSGPGGRSAAASSVSPGASGADCAAQGAVSGAASDQGISSQAQTLAPNFDQAAADRYAAARLATLERKQTYRTGAIGRALKPGPGGTDYMVPDAQVAQQFLTGRATEPDRVRAFLGTSGEGGQDVMRNALVNELRQSGVLTEEGQLKPAAFAEWQRRRADTISQLGLSDQFANANAAQRALNDATAAHEQALTDFQRSAAARFINDDPMIAVRKAFSSGNPTETFGRLAAAVRGNADAESGLKRAVVDFMVGKMSSSRAATESEDFLNAARFRKFIQANSGALKQLFGGQGVQNLDMVAADMRRSAYSGVSAAGSPTATYTNAVKRHKLVPGGHGGTLGGLSLMAVIGEQLAEHIGTHGLVGVAALPAGGWLVHTLRQAGVQTRNDLERLAMLHPNVARELMSRVGPSGQVGPLPQRRLARAVQATLGANAVQQIQQ